MQLDGAKENSSHEWRGTLSKNNPYKQTAFDFHEKQKHPDGDAWGSGLR